MRIVKTSDRLIAAALYIGFALGVLRVGAFVIEVMARVETRG